MKRRKRKGVKKKMAEKKEDKEEKEESGKSAAKKEAPKEEDQPHHKFPQQSKEAKEQEKEAREQVIKRHEEAVKYAEEHPAMDPEKALAADRKRWNEEHRAAIESAPIVAPWENPPPGVPRVEVLIQPVGTGIPQQVSR